MIAIMRNMPHFFGSHPQPRDQLADRHAIFAAARSSSLLGHFAA